MEMINHHAKPDGIESPEQPRQEEPSGGPASSSLPNAARVQNNHTLYF